MAHLERRLGLRHALSANLLSMVGIGPFLTIPTMVRVMGERHVLWAWLAGAVLALCDGLVFAHFGAALPGSGGAYRYLSESYKPLGLGRFVSFLFLMQVLFTAPLSIAGGAVGFADYLGYEWPAMTDWQHHGIAAALCVTVTWLLYRDIRSIGRLSMGMVAVVIATLASIVLGGAWSMAEQYFSGVHGAGPSTAWVRLPRSWDAAALSDMANMTGIAGLGSASLLAMYNYGGYNTACNLGDELREPARTLPRAILLSIAIAVVLNVAVSSAFSWVVPRHELIATRTVAPLFVRHLFGDSSLGPLLARAITLAVLVVAATSLYALLLGYSRVPFAAAQQGHFFRAFGRVHPTKNFPHVSVLALGLASVPFCFLPIVKLIQYLMLVQIVMQFLWLSAGVVLLHRHRKDIAQPFRMPWFPLPACIAWCMWAYVFATAPREGQLLAVGFFVAGVALYALYRRTTTTEAQVSRYEARSPLHSVEDGL
jgi:amino acid transporter